MSISRPRFDIFDIDMFALTTLFQLHKTYFQRSLPTAIYHHDPVRWHDMKYAAVVELFVSRSFASLPVFGLVGSISGPAPQKFIFEKFRVNLMWPCSKSYCSFSTRSGAPGPFLGRQSPLTGI
jgi:hypothetical protein